MGSGVGIVVGISIGSDSASEEKAKCKSKASGAGRGVVPSLSTQKRSDFMLKMKYVYRCAGNCLIVRYSSSALVFKYTVVTLKALFFPLNKKKLFSKPVTTISNIFSAR